MSKRTYSTSQVAKLLKIAQPNLQMMIREKRITAPPLTHAGAIKIRLWTEADVKHAREQIEAPHAKRGKRGAKGVHKTMKAEQGEIPSSLQEALKQGFKFSDCDAEESDNYKTETGEWSLVKRGPHIPIKFGGEDCFLEGPILAEIRIPYTKKVNWGRPHAV